MNTRNIPAFSPVVAQVLWALDLGICSPRILISRYNDQMAAIYQSLLTFAIIPFTVPITSTFHDFCVKGGDKVYMLRLPV